MNRRNGLARSFGWDLSAACYSALYLDLGPTGLDHSAASLPARIARGLGFALMPQHNVDHPGVVSRPLVEPTLWWEVNLHKGRMARAWTPSCRKRLEWRRHRRRFRLPGGASRITHARLVVADIARS
jgi:hypothetical protein